MTPDLPDADAPAAAPPPARPKTGFAGDVVKLVSGTAFGQALALAAAPIISRLFAPEAFGIAAVFASIVGIIGVVTCMRYELSIMLPKSDEEAANLFGVSLVFVVATSLLTIPLLWIFHGPLLRLLNAPALAPYLWLVPVAVLVSGLFLALNYWNTRTRHFGRLSIAQVTNSVTTTGTQVGAGYAGCISGGGLIVTNLFGSALATLVLAGQIWRDDRALFWRSLRWRQMLSGISRYRKFPLYGTWAALLNTASWQLPAIMLQGFFSATVVGYYALGTRVLRAPMHLFGSAIGLVFFQRAAQAKREGTLDRLVESAFQRLVALSLFPMFMMAIVGRDVFIVVFGPRWAEAGVYTQILSVWTFVWFISSPLSTLFGVLEKQEFGLLINIAIFLTRLLSLLIGGCFQDVRLALALFAVSGVGVYGYLVHAVMSAAGVSVLRAARIIGLNFLLFLPAGAVLIILTLRQGHEWLIVCVSVVLLCIYFSYVAARDPQIRRLFRVGTHRTPPVSGVP